MKKIAEWIARIVSEIKVYKLPEDKEEKKEYLKKFKKEIVKNKMVNKIRKEVLTFYKKFPIPAIG